MNRAQRRGLLKRVRKTGERAALHYRTDVTAHPLSGKFAFRVLDQHAQKDICEPVYLHETEDDAREAGKQILSELDRTIAKLGLRLEPA